MIFLAEGNEMSLILKKCQFGCLVSYHPLWRSTTHARVGIWSWTPLFDELAAVTIDTLCFKATYILKRWLLPHSAKAVVRENSIDCINVNTIDSIALTYNITNGTQTVAQELNYTTHGGSIITHIIFHYLILKYNIFGLTRSSSGATIITYVEKISQ